jgi:hypothetical protein
MGMSVVSVRGISVLVDTGEETAVACARMTTVL